MAFYDTYGESKKAAQSNTIARDAQTMQGLQAFADFLLKKRTDTNDSVYKQALARQANATADFNSSLNSMVQGQMGNGGQVMTSNNPSIQMPSQVPGQQPQFLSPSQLQQQQAMLAQAQGGQQQSPLQLAGITRNGVSLQNPNYMSQGEQRRSEKQDFTISSTLREKFEGLPEVKDYNLILPNIKSMEKILDAVKDGKIQNYTGSDQVLVTMFNKLTDPQSVVRESEFARTPENAPLVNRIMGAIPKAINGGLGLTNEDREALVTAAEVILNERGDIYNQRLVEYNDLADAYGIEKRKVTKNLKPHSRGQFSRIEDEQGGGSQDIVGDILSQLENS